MQTEVLTEASRRQKLRILVVTPFIPKPDTSAGDRRLVELIHMLAGKHHVYVCPLYSFDNFDLTEHYAQQLRDLGVNVLPTFWRHIGKALFKHIYDIGIFEFWHSAKCIDVVRRHQPWIKVVVDSVDLHFQREEAGLAVGISDPETVEVNKRQELKVYRAADAVITISQNELQLLADYGEMPPLFSLPLIIQARQRAATSRGNELLFIGGFNHAPNADGLLWFMEQIWPAVKAQVPDVHLTIVGSNATPQVCALAKIDGIEFAGHVPDTAPYLERAAVSIAPLRFGAGMKGKVTEAMAAGLPVVTTSYGQQGLNTVPSEHLMVADQPADFAQQVVYLLCNVQLAEKIGKNGQKHIASICGPTMIEKSLEGMLETVLTTKAPTLPPAKWIFRSGFLYAKAYVRGSLQVTGILQMRRRLFTERSTHA